MPMRMLITKYMKDLNTLKPEHQLLTIESNINEWFNRLKQFIKTNPLNKSTKRKSNFLKIKP